MNHISEDTFSFLRQLTENNTREWFAEHKEQYEQDVRQPAFALIENIAPALAEISPHFIAKASKVGGSLMRVHRDVRFSKNKQPYKTHIGIQFRHEQGKDIHAPGFYVHIEANEVFLGSGIWHPDGTTLRAIRQHIDTFPKAWNDALNAPLFCKHFNLSGDSLKRAPKGYPINHPMIDELKRKDFIAITHIAPELCLEADFADIVSDYFKLTIPLMSELCRAIRVPF